MIKMMVNIFLNEFKHKKSVNTSESLNISLKGKRKLLPTSDVSDVVSQYDVYTEEREKCNKIRLTCQVNAVCSNILCNSITEIIEDEGSPRMSFLNYGIISGESYNGIGASNQDVTNKTIYGKDKKLSSWLNGNKVTNAIRDTQLSNCGYIYHCGYDIFNNHLIRSNTFKTVCQIDNTDTSEEFNTIKDTLRNEDGDTVTERVYFPVSSGLLKKGDRPINLHLYKYDDIYTYNKCIENRLVTSFEGWIGFYNKAKMKTYYKYGTKNEEVMGINKPIMYMNGGDFVDMYPDRSLYSFIPKYNKFKNRVEKNWNYCLTYPSSSTSRGFDDIMETNNNSLRALYFNENTIADNGTRQLVIYSIVKHGLSVGDYVNIYSTDSTSSTTLVLNNVRVEEVADEFIFTVFSTVQLSKYWVEISDEDYNGSTRENPLKLILDGEENNFILYKKKYFLKQDSNNIVDLKNKYFLIDGTRYVNFDKDAQNISYKKVVNGIECDYYIRIFSKIPNFKYASGDTSSEYEIYKNDGEMIQEYQKNKYDFESHVSKLAFASNIYSDGIAEVVFTDDIDISNLKDNLGRPVSSIYLTIIKNNAGYKEWYGFDVNDSSGENWNVEHTLRENVEFSHCFGGITCGIQTSEETKFSDDINSINKLTPITESDNGLSGMSITPGFNVDIINGDRDLYEGDDKMYDIDPTEVWFKLDRNYFGDLCYYDNYNAIEVSIQPILHRFNTAQRECLGSKTSIFFEYFKYDEILHDDYDSASFKVDDSNMRNNCNSKMEGYYYNPHYEIRIKTFDKIQTMMPDFLTITKINAYEDSVRFTSLERHYLSLGDRSVVYDMSENKYYNCITIKGFKDNSNTYTCRMYDENNNLAYPTTIFKDEDNIYKPISNFKVFKIDNLDAPNYAKILKDGTCRLIWRNVLNNGFNTSDDSVEEYPFTNGAFYINKGINLYVRRQDPYDIWGLYSNDDIPGVDINTEEDDIYVKDSDIQC